MHKTLHLINIVAKPIFPILLVLTASLAWGQAHEAELNFIPAQATVDFTLGDVLHTVHGQFHLRSGQIHFTPGTNAIGGQIVVDVTSGNSGNGSRDRKMHKEILESQRYPDATFRPESVEGDVATVGTSTVQVHGMFGIHGAEHEITVPVQVELAPDHWNLTAKFSLPYVKWGMKDPSTFILRVEKTVEIDLHASGLSPWATQH